MRPTDRTNIVLLKDGPSRAVAAEVGSQRREISALRQAGRPAGGRPVVRDRAFDVARHLEQVRPHGVESVMHYPRCK